MGAQLIRLGGFNFLQSAAACISVNEKGLVKLAAGLMWRGEDHLLCCDYCLCRGDRGGWLAGSEGDL